MNLKDMLALWLYEIEKECEDTEVVEFIKDSIQAELRFYARYRGILDNEAIITMLLMNNKTLIALMGKYPFVKAKRRAVEISKRVRDIIGGGLQALERHSPEVV